MTKDRSRSYQSIVRGNSSLQGIFQQGEYCSKVHYSVENKAPKLTLASVVERGWFSQRFSGKLVLDDLRPLRIHTRSFFVDVSETLQILRIFCRFSFSLVITRAIFPLEKRFSPHCENHFFSNVPKPPRRLQRRDS